MKPNSSRVNLIIILIIFLVTVVPAGTEPFVRVRILEKYHPDHIVVSFDESIYENHTITTDSQFPIRFQLQTNYKISLPEKAITRTYSGMLSITDEKGELVIINTVSMEEYVASVVISEMGNHHPEAMKAQAVVSRSWAVCNLKPDRSHDFCDLTISQSYQGYTPFHDRVRNLISVTRGEILKYKGKRANVVYHAACSDRTLSSASIWGGQPVPYLKNVGLPPEAFGKNGMNQWKVTLLKKDVDRIISNVTGDTGIKDYSQSLKNGQHGIYTGHDWIGIDRFRLSINRVLGWNTLKSNDFVLTQTNESLLFNGKGFGHLVGMCQQEAVNLADNGWSYSDILSLFYPGCDIKPEF